MNPNDQVEFYHGGWRTGIYLGVVEKGENFGMIRVKPNFLDVKELLINPERVKLLVNKELEELLS